MASSSDRTLTQGLDGSCESLTGDTATFRRAALRLWSYLSAAHLRRGLLAGPDPVGRFNGRVWRFLKNYAGARHWHDDFVFLQGQGYWTSANWWLFKATGDARYGRAALDCSQSMVSLQRADGAWVYPSIDIQRRGLIATVEGVSASLGLMASYVNTQDERWLDVVRRWMRFLDQRIGYQAFLHPVQGESLAVNYYLQLHRGMVPNNTTMLLDLLTLLAAVGEGEYLGRYQQLMHFVRGAQLRTGELAYEIPERDHYLCFQYNAYELLNLAAARRRTADAALDSLLASLSAFVRVGQLGNGACAADCFRRYPEVNYYTAALGHALGEVAEMGYAKVRHRAKLAFQRVVRAQRPDGSFGYSRRDYWILSDGRSYPRYLAMILYHLCWAGWPDARPVP